MFVDNVAIGVQSEKEVHIEDMEVSCILKDLDEESNLQSNDMAKQNVLLQENNIENQDISQHEKVSIFKFVKRIIVKLKNKFII